MARNSLVLAITLAGFALASSDGSEPESLLSADLLIVNARIWTGDAHKPEAAALAVNHGRIIFVKTAEEWDQMQKQGIRVKADRVLDLKGNRVVPGFYDSHVHFLGTGMRLGQVALKDAKDEEEFGRRLREFDQKLPRDRWMLGGNWDHDRALNGALPTAALIDKYVKDRPVFLNRYDGHMAVANTRALQLAGINAKTTDVMGGVIYRKPGTDQPTGLLRDAAMMLMDKAIPPPDDTEIAEAVRGALAMMRANGLTSVQDMDGSASATRRKLFRLYQWLAKEGKLTCRVDLRWPILSWRELADLGVTAGFGDDWVRIGGVKGFIDGSLGSTTAKFFQPYLNEPSSTGIFVTPLFILGPAVRNADKAGLSVAVHAIGDQGNAEMLNIYAEAAKANGSRDRRFRIEHAQHLRPQDIPRFKELGVVASMQPYHIVDDGRWAESRIGPERCASSYANRSLLDAGAVLAFGSDSPVAPLNVLLGIDAAVNRRTLDGKHLEGWFPKQKITVEEALRAYTWGSAYAGSEEKDRGTLAPGFLGDCVVLSRDILDPAERDQIGQTDVLMTVLGGTVVFEKK
jgi:predicted amidohydrolase YtcJ